MPRVKRLWKASKLYQLPLFDPVMAEFNDYDLELLQYLEYFENPENEKKYKNTFIDDDFNEFWENYEDIPPDSNVDISNESEWVEVTQDE